MKARSAACRRDDALAGARGRGARARKAPLALALAALVAALPPARAQEEATTPAAWRSIIEQAEREAQQARQRLQDASARLDECTKARREAEHAPRRSPAEHLTWRQWMAGALDAEQQARQAALKCAHQQEAAQSAYRDRLDEAMRSLESPSAQVAAAPSEEERSTFLSDCRARWRDSSRDLSATRAQIEQWNALGDDLERRRADLENAPAPVPSPDNGDAGPAPREGPALGPSGGAAGGGDIDHTLNQLEKREIDAADPRRKLAPALAMEELLGTARLMLDNDRRALNDPLREAGEAVAGLEREFASADLVSAARGHLASLQGRLRTLEARDQVWRQRLDAVRLRQEGYHAAIDQDLAAKTPQGRSLQEKGLLAALAGAVWALFAVLCSLAGPLWARLTLPGDADRLLRGRLYSRLALLALVPVAATGALTAVIDLAGAELGLALAAAVATVAFLLVVMRGLLEDVLAGARLLFQAPFRLGDELRIGEMAGVVGDFSLTWTRLDGPKGQALVRNAAVDHLVRLTRRECAAGPDAPERASSGDGSAEESAAEAVPRPLGPFDAS